jgi:hypothetical protein
LEKKKIMKIFLGWLLGSLLGAFIGGFLVLGVLACSPCGAMVVILVLPGVIGGAFVGGCFGTIVIVTLGEVDAYKNELLRLERQTHTKAIDAIIEEAEELIAREEYLAASKLVHPHKDDPVVEKWLRAIIKKRKAKVKRA